MGTFTDNLLKLTEFPFSYSLISLITLIALGEGLLNQPPERLALLFILMGFVATTLSMTDPIGVLLKESLYGFRGRIRLGSSALLKEYVYSPYLSSVLSRFPSAKVSRHIDHSDEYDLTKLSAEEKKEYLLALITEMYDLSIFGDRALLFAISNSIINAMVIICLSPDFLDIFSRRHFRDAFYRIPQQSQIGRTYVNLQDVLEMEETIQIFAIILSLKKSSLGAVWMVREVDKITGMIYFLIVVAILISTLVSDKYLNTSFLDNFLDIFQGSEQASEQAKAQARQWIFLILVIVFVAVTYKLYRRLNELQSKAFTTFIFLIEREAIKIEATKKEKNTFDKSLQEIERYLTNGDWTLAELLVHRLMNEYGDFVRREWIEKKEITAEEGKDVEKKIMIKWKDGEMSVEEVRDVEKKISREEAKSIEQKKE